MRMDEIGIPVQDCRVSKLFSSIAGRPAKLFDEKSSKLYSCHTKLSEHIWGCNEHGTIHVISSDFGDRMTTQSIELMVLLSEHF